jgi:[ribosomal protein S5]-alanine N-acetyltransferase
MAWKKMKTSNIETERLIITNFDVGMSESVYLNSLDEDNRRFMADEVFASAEEARTRILALILCYESGHGLFVYPVLLQIGSQIGHVEAMMIGRGWEIGFHIGKSYTRRGYATEAVKAFLPVIMAQLGLVEIYAICHDTNIASKRVLQKCGFLLEFAGIGLIQGKTQLICRYKLMVK